MSFELPTLVPVEPREHVSNLFPDPLRSAGERFSNQARRSCRLLCGARRSQPASEPDPPHAPLHRVNVYRDICRPGRWWSYARRQHLSGARERPLRGAYSRRFRAILRNVLPNESELALLSRRLPIPPLGCAGRALAGARERGALPFCAARF